MAVAEHSRPPAVLQCCSSDSAQHAVVYPSRAGSSTPMGQSEGRLFANVDSAQK